MTEKHLEELIQKYANDTASDDELRQLMAWYHSTPVDELQWPGTKEDVYSRMWHRLQKQVKPKENKVVVFPWQKIAAALIIIIGAGFLLLRITKPSAASYVTITNPSGQIKALSLPDGSHIWLNAKSELRYKKSFSDNRELELNGEAFFEVAHDTVHPFVVKTGELQTTVLGTSFNVKGYKDENITSVSLISGSVKIENDFGTTLLKPSHQLSYNKAQQNSQVAAIDTTAVLAWKKGRLQFEGESLESITASLERWYDVRFVFTNPSMKNCRYYMGFDNNLPFEKTVSMMAELTEMQYSVVNNTVTVSGKGCQ